MSSNKVLLASRRIDLKAEKVFLDSCHSAATMRFGENSGTDNYHTHRKEINIEFIHADALPHFWAGMKVDLDIYGDDTYLTPPIPGREERTRDDLPKDLHSFVHPLSDGSTFTKIQDPTDAQFGTWGDGNQYDTAPSQYGTDMLTNYSDMRYFLSVHGASNSALTFDTRIGNNIANDIAIGTAVYDVYGGTRYNIQPMLRFAKQYLIDKGYAGNIAINAESYGAGGRAGTNQVQVELGIKSFQIEFSRNIRDNWQTFDTTTFLTEIAKLFVYYNPY